MTSPSLEPALAYSYTRSRVCPHTGTLVEVELTRDRKEDHADGNGWSCIPVPPAGAGWLLWDTTTSDRKSSWVRVWAKSGHQAIVHVRGGVA